jgi:hypothetical protein
MIRQLRSLGYLYCVRSIVTECDKCLGLQDLQALLRHSVNTNRAWWWAQNWAHLAVDSRLGFPSAGPRAYPFILGFGRSVLARLVMQISQESLTEATKAGIPSTSQILEILACRVP